MIVTSYIWPFEARRELRRGLSEYVLHPPILSSTDDSLEQVLYQPRLFVRTTREDLLEATYETRQSLPTRGRREGTSPPEIRFSEVRSRGLYRDGSSLATLVDQGEFSIPLRNEIES